MKEPIVHEGAERLRAPGRRARGVTRSPRRTRIGLAIALVTGVVLAAAGVAGAADEIVLGAAISQTGKYAREGKFYVDAYTLTVDAVNNAGGVTVGGKPYKLALKLYDDQSDPNLSVRLFTRQTRRCSIPTRPSTAAWPRARASG